MVRGIIWSKKADFAFCRILEFYNNRNGNNSYSRKISKEITQLTNLLTFHPQLGQLSDFPNIRVVLKGNYKVFYEILSDCIFIHMVWDSRQNPENLKMI